MVDVKLSAPVGDVSRNSGAKVANKKSDVELVQSMLTANGFGTPVTGTMNRGTQKAIVAAQKKLMGSKAPDGVVDPGGKMSTALKPKYVKYLKELEKTRFYRLPQYNNVVVPEATYLKMEKEMLTNLRGIHKIMQKSFAASKEMHIEYLRAGAAEKGILRAVSTAIVITAGQIKLPSKRLMDLAEGSLINLKRCISAKDFAAIDNAMFEADRTLSNYDKDILRYLSQISRTSWYIGTSLNVTTCAGWIVVGAMATPILVTAGAGSAGAVAISGAGVAAMQSAVNEVGGYAEGKQSSAFNAAYNIMIDGTIGGVTGVIGGKLPEPFKKTVGKYLSGRVAAKFGQLAGGKAEAVLIDWLSHAGAEVAAEALGSAVKLIGATAKSGKMPTQKEFEAATCDILFKLMGSNFLKLMGGLETKAAVAGKGILTDRLVPEWFNKYAKGDVPPDVRKAIMNTVTTKLNEEAAKQVFLKGVSDMKGKPTDTKLMKQGADKTIKEKKLEGMVDKEMRAAMRKHKCPMK